jgi:hypothetical protein
VKFLAFAEFQRGSILKEEMHKRRGWVIIAAITGFDLA